MKEKDVVSILMKQGWVCKKDEVGDYFCITDLGDVQLQIIPVVRKNPDHFRVSFMSSISSKEFSAAVSFILGNEKGDTPVVVSNGAPEKLVSFSTDDVIRLSEMAVSWARCQSIDEGLMVYRKLPTDAKGGMPIRHLAALAIAGDTKTLEGYRKSFEGGDRLGFVPYITADMIDRALKLSSKNKIAGS